jgi:hypothetical protein
MRTALDSTYKAALIPLCKVCESTCEITLGFSISYSNSNKKNIIMDRSRSESAKYVL